MYLQAESLQCYKLSSSFNKMFQINSPFIIISKTVVKCNLSYDATYYSHILNQVL